MAIGDVHLSWQQQRLFVFLYLLLDLWGEG